MAFFATRRFHYSWRLLTSRAEAIVCPPNVDRSPAQMRFGEDMIKSRLGPFRAIFGRACSKSVTFGLPVVPCLFAVLRRHHCGPNLFFAAVFVFFQAASCGLKSKNTRLRKNVEVCERANEQAKKKRCGVIKALNPSLKFAPLHF